MGYPTWEQWKGAVRVQEIKEYYEARGYKCSVFNVSDHTVVDMIAENDRKVIALEICNWKEDETLTIAKFLGWLKHWDKVQAEMKANGDNRRLVRRLVYSYPENIQYILDYLLRYSIELQCMGADNESDVVVKHSKEEKR